MLWGRKHICFLLQKENHNALFKNSCLIFSIYIMLIRVLIRILLSHVWCWTPFPEIVNTRPFTFPREFWIFIRRSEDKSWKLTHYVTLSRGSDVQKWQVLAENQDLRIYLLTNVGNLRIWTMSLNRVVELGCRKLNFLEFWMIEFWTLGLVELRLRS